MRTVGDGGDAKVAEQETAISAHEHILWLDIAMDDTALMSVLQSGGYLLYIAYNRGQWQLAPFGMAISQRPSLRIFHHQKRLILVTEPKVEQWHNMGMAQTNGAGFVEKGFEILRVDELDLEEFDGGR